MKGARDIGGRELYRKITLIDIHAGISNPSALPFGAPVRFNWGWLIGFGEFTLQVRRWRIRGI
jgi:hypothetical protein